NARDLLVAPRLDWEQIAALRSRLGLKDVAEADANLQGMAGEPAEHESLAQVLEELLRCVSQSADPDQALTYLERFARASLHKIRLFSHLKDSPVALEILARTMGGSPYMAEILIRDPQHFYWVADPEVLRKARSRRSVKHELLRTLKLLELEDKQLDYLRFFKRREMLHIGVRDLLRVCTVEETL